MKAKPLIIGLSLFLQACSGAWHEMSSTAMQFKVSMPGAASRSAYTADGDRWKGEGFRLEAGSAWATLFEPARSLAFWARGEEIPDGWSNEQVIKKYTDERLRSTGSGRSVETSAIQHGELTGVQLSIKDQGVLLRTRVFVVGKRAYTLEVMSSDASVGTEAVERYFSSFHLLR